MSEDEQNSQQQQEQTADIEVTPKADVAEKPKAPPSHKVRHPLVVGLSALFSFLFLLVLAAGGALYYGKSLFEQAGPLKEDKTIFIARGQGVREISLMLEREGAIEHPNVFVFAAQVLKTAPQLKAGEYLLKANMSAKDIMDVFVEGKAILHSISFPEGLTSLQIVQRLQENEILTGNVTRVPDEGSILPETYKFSRGTTRDQILKRMQEDQKKAVAEIWAKRHPSLPLKTMEEFVTLASIVEKETGKADERPRVAAVFFNRLKKGMRLQSDPTIVYGIVGGGGMAALGRPLSRADIDTKTAFNTYQIDGLPPSPIANPGKASLEAVANPPQTNDLYFVARGNDGTHVFSETYEQHLRAVGNLRSFEREQKESRQNASEPAPQTGQGAVPNGSATGKDAVEGTAKDPLKNETYDLNSPKQVPKL